MQPNKPKVFISYGREDIETARRLYNDLNARGIEVWFDKESLLGGQRWKPTISQALRDSNYVLALLSTSSVTRRGYFQKELKEALDVLDEYPESAIYLIPVRLDDCKPPHEKLHELQWINLFPSYDEGLRRVLQVVTSEANFALVEPPLPSKDERAVIDDMLSTGQLIDAIAEGRRYLHRGQYTRSLAVLEYIRDAVDPQHSQYYIILGNIAYNLVRLNRDQQALDYLAQVENANNGDTFFSWHEIARAVAHLHLGNVDECRRSLARAMTKPEYDENQVKQHYPELIPYLDENVGDSL